MSDETPGAGQGALPPREDSTSRNAVRLTQVQGGQYILTSQTHNIPGLSQINISPNTTLTQGSVPCIISLTPASRNQTSPLRPSLTNQSIVNALTKSPRANPPVRHVVGGGGDAPSPQNATTPTRSPVKRSLPSTPEKRDTYASKLQRVMNHRNVRSKIVKEKYNEHTLECYYVGIGGNILDLYQFAKRPKTQQFLAYLKENAIDPKDHVTEITNNQPQVPLTPTATSASSLPGISQSSTITVQSSITQSTVQPTQCDTTEAKSTNGNKKLSVTYPTTPIGNSQEQIVEKAKQEAYVVQRVSDLQKEGLWSEKRLPKIQEMPRAKAHWDFLLEEMVWLAADFAQERKWKKAAAKKCARMVQKYFQDKALAAQRAEKAQEQHIRRIAAFCAKEIKTFWNNVEKLVEYKQNTRLDEKRKKALDQHLSFIVDQTEKYSQLLAEGMNKPGVISTPDQTVPASNASSRSASRANSDDEFHPDSENSTDDEETIAQEEATNKEEESAEVAALQRESEMDFEAFLSELPKDYLQNRENIKLCENEQLEAEKPDSTKKDDLKLEKKVDDDFVADSSSEEDNEDTIQEQEETEGGQDHKQEMEDLQAENELSLEELKKKYADLSTIPIEDAGSVSSESSEEEEESSVDESDHSEEEEEEIGMSNESHSEEEDDIGLKSLLDNAGESQNGGEENKTDNNDLINDAAAIAESIQPKGNTLSSTSVVTRVPFLLKLPLREYQHIGLDWLVTMFERKLNGILADEMGLGKTIQTIALLAHLACEKENWGPHLIIVPTSVMLNWEMECKKWCPAFKILTYYGTQKERKTKRTGWTKPNAFHICITSYKLVIQDHQSFRRKKWKYLILDEAQNIKNFKSQRWQLLLNFQTQQRLLLTGTPLQNNLMELWSLMHFLMPNVFQSHREFKEWFSNPVTGMIEGNSEYNESIIKRLHKVLRPFLLRRLKSEVEKQMPKKYEHIIMCRLSKRQRFLYDDYMSRAKTRETLASGNLLSVINVLMQLRKVCNHPNLFEVRPTISPFHCEGIVEHIPSLVYRAFEYDPFKDIDLSSINLNLLAMEFHLSAYQCYRMRQYQTPRRLIEDIDLEGHNPPYCPPARLNMKVRKLDPPKEIKIEPKEETALVKVNPVLPNSPNIKLKLGTGFQVIQQGIPVSQTTTSQSSGANINLSGVYKPSEKITVPAGFAQLVQTSTGKHILFTPTSCISTSNLGLTGTATVMTSSGQRLTVLSQSPNANNTTPQTLTKAVVKVQLTSVPATTTPTMSVTTPEVKYEERSLQTRTVSSKYLDKLYASQSNKKDLDVRWLNNEDEKGVYENSEDMNHLRSEKKDKIELISRINLKRCNAVPLYGMDFRESVKVDAVIKKSTWTNGGFFCRSVQHDRLLEEATECLRNLVHRPADRMEQLKDVFNRFIVFVPAVHAPEAELQVWHPSPSVYWGRKQEKQLLVQRLSRPTTLLHPIVSAMVTQFPHPRLIQYDCGKLQTLDRLLRKLKYGSHRVLIFTQMTKMLDVLEAFLNFHGHIYLRLDGTTKVDQRQMLMERFNGDKRIFVFILSTRSGGIGVNLTGADTVIFYDSDWNPTMDAQAQDRCHRIGQTRDVHIYRLVSEKTIEENILKKANQKRLLGDLAIEGGNFTTAYFKSSTIQDLFDINSNEEMTAASRMSEVLDCNRERERHLTGEVSTPTTPITTSEDKVAMGALENALAACEDDQDVQAARTAKAEAVADLAEFDENIPLEEQEKEKEPEISKAEMEVENLIKQLTPIERYAMRFIEETEAAWSAEQLAAAEREIEDQKHEWERNRLVAMQEEKERRARELEENETEPLTFSRDDSTNQVWLSHNTMEQMPMWCPPTPPQQDTDVYIDQTMAFLYDINIMSETQLPPVYIKKENKRSRHEAGLNDGRRVMKIHRKDESMYAPRSLFERPSPALVKMRRDIKLQKNRGIVRPAVPVPGMKLPISKPSVDPPCFHNWTIHEDMALLKVIQSFQGLPLNLIILTPGHTPNWDFVADYVNTVSITFRSPKQCRNRYETVLIPREEGKQVFDTSPRKKKNKSNMYKFPMQNKSGRPMRTSQLYSQDNNLSFSHVMTQRYDSLKVIANKRTSSTKTVLNNPMLKNPKHLAVLNECGIDLDHPVLPVEVAARRAERIAREKKATPDAQRLLIKNSLNASQTSSSSTGTGSTVQVLSSSVAQVTLVQTTTTVTTVTTTVISTPGTPPNTLRTQRIVASPMQTPTVVSVSGLSPAQLRAATQRLIVSGTPGQAKAVVGGTATVSSKTISPAQLQLLRQATLKQQQLRLQTGGLAAAATGQVVKTNAVTISGQPTAVQVQFTQAQARAQQVSYVKPAVTLTGKQGLTRTVTESEMTQLFKQRQLHQQQKVLAASSGQTTTIQNLSPQGFAQAIQQAGSSGTPVATLVKAVSSSGVTQTVTIPVTIGQVKALAPGGTIKTTTPQQLRQMQLQQQLLAQKKLGQKIGIAQVTGKGGVATQLIVGSKPFSTPITMQQFQQVIKSPLAVQQPAVLVKGTPRVIPVNATQGNKPTIQVVAATSQGITTTIRPQSSSALAGALTGIKVQGNVTSQAHLLSQVSAALQSQNVVRQSSPVRIQTGTGTPIVAVSVQQSSSNMQSNASPQISNAEKSEQVSRLLKK